MEAAVSAAAAHLEAALEAEAEEAGNAHFVLAHLCFWRAACGPFARRMTEKRQCSGLLDIGKLLILP